MQNLVFVRWEAYEMFIFMIFWPGWFFKDEDFFYHETITLLMPYTNIFGDFSFLTFHERRRIVSIIVIFECSVPVNSRLALSPQQSQSWHGSLTYLKSFSFCRNYVCTRKVNSDAKCFCYCFIQAASFSILLSCKSFFTSLQQH